LCLTLLGCAAAEPPPGVTVGDVVIDDVDLTVWIADSASERSQGLMGVERLPSGIDGMLFVFEEPSARSFHMLQTPMPLDIWWFGPDGALLGSTEMEPCPETPCPSYGSPGAVSWALETPVGSVDLTAGARLTTVESE
jgi:uncharacterized membrane protein (UPF0127 family)